MEKKPLPVLMQLDELGCMEKGAPLFGSKGEGVGERGRVGLGGRRDGATTRILSEFKKLREKQVHICCVLWLGFKFT